MIRAYRESDFSEIEQIYNLSKKDEFIGEQFVVSVTPLSEDKQMLDLFKTSTIFIYKKNCIAGFIGIKENYISWLFVHPDFRGQNIGKKLVLYIMSRLSGEVTLNVARSNVAATRLYNNLGFEMTKEFTGRYQGNPIIVWKMSTELKNG